MARVAIVTSGHFCTNPRVWREADALSARGHDVTVAGVSFDPAQAAQDRQMLAGRTWRHEVAADLVGTAAGRQLAWAWRRLEARAGRALLGLGVETPWALGYAVPALLRVARRLRADLVQVHLEPALWVGAQLLREGARVGIDVEDWYSENDAAQGHDEAPRRRFLQRLEQEVLAGAVHRSTTSDAMATALAERYCCARPVTIYNASAARPLSPAPSAPGLRLVWFSQTLGPGRGLEDLCAALPLLHGEWEVEIRARASADARAWLERLVPETARPHVRVEPVVPPDELAAVVARHDVGLALESPRFPNKDLTASNKIFEYLQNGLRVAASDTAGQREVLARVPNAGDTYPSGDAQRLAALLNGWIDTREAIRADRARLHQAANATLAYEHQTGRLVESLEAALR